MASSSEEPCSSSMSSSRTRNDSECAESQTDSDGVAVSLVDKLRWARPSDLTRKRKIDTNVKPPHGKRRSCSSGRGSSDPKSVSPKQRAAEFPNESLSESNGKLFCLACREELSELPQYIACSEDVTLECDLLQWWKAKQSDLPTWAACVKKVLCIQPSSAAAERVFSLLQVTFNDRQGLALQDYIETALMLQYNGR